MWINNQNFEDRIFAGDHPLISARSITSLDRNSLTNEFPNFHTYELGLVDEYEVLDFDYGPRTPDIYDREYDWRLRGNIYVRFDVLKELAVDAAEYFWRYQINILAFTVNNFLVEMY